MPNIRVGKITPVALQNVDIIDAQPFQTVFHRREDMLEHGQPQMSESPSQDRTHLAGEPVSVDVANFVRLCHDWRSMVIPNCEEHLCGSS